MKANELMIGDWVLYQCNPLRVQHIYNDGYDDIVAEITEENAGEDGLYEEVHYVRLNDCSPIPLTEEILEKNGWVKYGRPYGWRKGIEVQEWCHTDMRVSFGILQAPKYDGYTWRGVKINEVHLFQHALRLCGLNELADNLKV